jgi:hypothetical protein
MRNEEVQAMSERFNVFRYGDELWIRAFGYQLGWHQRGRKRLLSERYGRSRGPLTVRVGRRAEVSLCKVMAAPS